MRCFNRFVEAVLYFLVLIAVPFFLMLYCLKCERLRLSEQKRSLDRIIEQQRWQKMMKEAPKYDIFAEDPGPGCPSNLPERY